MEKSKYKGQKAISYQRASAGKGRGQDDSTDRQSDTAIVYCEEMGMELDLSYSILDEGVSAYRTVSYTDESGKQRQGAKNLVEGALAQFVDNVKGGAFPNGINLIIEKLDRMYRDDPMDAMGHFLALLKEGVTIHTMIDKQVYSKHSENKQVTMMMSIMYLVASHQYSKDLSKRIKMSYERRIEKMVSNEGLFIPTGRLKDWIKVIEVEGSKKPFVDPEHGKLIKTIHEMYLDGISVPKICQHFQAEGILDYNGNVWEHWKLADVLKDRAVIGKYTPKDGVELHFEEIRVVSDELFYQVQDKLKSKYRKGRQSKEGHVFRDIIKCGYCETTKKQTRLKGTAHPSTLRFSPAYRNKQENIPTEVKLPYRGYKCTRGVQDKRDCYGGKIDYYTVQSAFFAFVKELNFAELLKPNKKIDTKIHEQKINQYRAKIAEINVQIEDLEKGLKFIKSESGLEMFGQKVDALLAEKETQEQKIINEKLTLQNLEDDRLEVLHNENNIKELMEKSSSDHEYMAFMKNLVGILAKKDGRGEYKDKQTKWTKKDQLLLDEMMELWNLRYQLIHADREGDGARIAEVEQRQEELRFQYFRKEIEQDRVAYNLKLRLNAYIKKFVKEIKVYQFGFSEFMPTPEYINRKGKASNLKRHNESLTKFILEYDESMNEEIAKVKKSKKTKVQWKQYEVMQMLGCKDRKTYRRWVARGMPNVLEGDTLEDAVKWVKTDRIMNPRNKINVQKENISKRFLSFSIEFTEMVNTDIVKYIIPHWKDVSCGVSFNLDKSDGSVKWSNEFGRKTIKRFRTKSKKAKQKEENVIYVDQDPYFAKAIELAEDASFPFTTMGMDPDVRSIMEEAKDIDFTKGRNLKPKEFYTLANYKKRKSFKTRMDFIMDAGFALGHKSTEIFDLIDEVIQLGGKVAQELEVTRDNFEEWFATLVKAR